MRQAALTLLALAVLNAAPRATVLIPTDLAQMTREARAVARGEVVAVDARWTDDRRSVETIVTLQTERYLKGQMGETIQFRVPGGRIGRFRNLVVGAPTFDIGQRVVVFLGANGPRVPYVLGLSQGVYRIAATPAGALMVTPPPIDGAVEGPIVRGAIDRQPAPLAQFERTVLAMAGTSR